MSLIKNRFKVCSSLPVILIMSVIAMLIVPAIAMANTSSDGFEYYSYAEHSEVWGYTGSNTALVIPATLGGEPVTAVGLLENDNITSITMPNTVTSLGSFESCINLQSIEVSPNVATIAPDSFKYCSSLGSITIPAGVTSIPNETFSGCTGLTTLTLPSTVTSIGDMAFYGCNSLQNITIPNEVATIGNEAFYQCTNLKYLVIPNSVTQIADSAFSGCSGLTSLTISSTLHYIGNSVFANCSSLTDVTIPNSVTHIGYGAFSGCSSLNSVTIPDTVTNMAEGYAFANCSSLTSIPHMGGMTQITQGTFSNCEGLTSLNIEDQITSLGDSAFASDTSLSSVVIPAQITSIGNSTFSNCSALTIGKIYNANTTYGSNVFQNSNPTIMSYNNSTTHTYATANSVSFAAFDQSAPGQPDELSAPMNLVSSNLTSNSFTLSWRGVNQTTFYNIYQDNQLVGCSTSSNFTVINLEPSIRYSFYVTACNGDIEGPDSTPFNITLTAANQTAPLDAPQNLRSANLTTSSVDLQWDSVAGATGYNIYKNGALLGSAETTDLNATGLWLNNSYTFEVTAYTDSIESNYSSPLYITPSLDAPQNLSATDQTNSTFVLSWDPVPNVDGYYVYQNNQFFTTVDASETTQFIGNLTAGTTNSYQVSAYVDSGAGTESPPLNVTLVNLPNNLAAPQNLKAIDQTNTTFILCWDPVDGADGYSIYQNGTFLRTVGASDNSNYIYDLQNNTPYSYKVTATLNSTESVPSDTFNITLAYIPPQAIPQNLTASNLYSNSFVLNWDAVTDAQYYYVYQNGFWAGIAYSNSLEIAGLDPGVPYSYTASDINSVSESGQSVPFNITLSASSPTLTVGVPQNLQAGDETNTSFVLAWDPVANATGYNIYQNDKIMYGVDPSSTDSYIAGLQPSTTYTYAVTACLGPDESAKSVPLNVTLAYTPPPAAPQNLTSSNSYSNAFVLHWDNIPTANYYYIYEDGNSINYSYTNSLEVINLQPGVPHSFTVTEVSGGATSDQSEPLSVTLKDSDPTYTIPVPQNLKATNLHSDFFTLTWDAIPNVAYYNIYQDGYCINQVASNQVGVSDLVANTQYSYTVSACDSSNNEGDRSDALPVTLNSTDTAFVLGVPQNLKADNLTTNSCELHWDAVSGADNYSIYQDGSWQFDVDGTNLSATMNGLQLDNTYSFTVTSSIGDFDYESDYSDPVSVTLTEAVIAAPTNLASSNATSTSFTLSWDAVSGASRYNVYKGDDTYIGTTTSLNYNMSGLQPSVTYTFVVTALTDTDTSGDSAPLSVILAEQANQDAGTPDVTASGNQHSILTDGTDYFDTVSKTKKHLSDLPNLQVVKSTTDFSSMDTSTVKEFIIWH